jgi:hypothetical protein
MAQSSFQLFNQLNARHGLDNQAYSPFASSTLGKPGEHTGTRARSSMSCVCVLRHCVIGFLSFVCAALDRFTL